MVDQNTENDKVSEVIKNQPKNYLCYGPAIYFQFLSNSPSLCVQEWILEIMAEFL